MQRYKREELITKEAEVLARFILPAQTYPLYCVSKLSSGADTGEK